MVTATVLKDLISISLPQATYYLAIINAPTDVKEQIKAGKINNLDKAAVIAKVQSIETRKLAIEACIEGYSLKQLRMLIDSNLKTKLETNVKPQGRALKRINMGSTAKPHVVKKIVQFALEHPEGGRYKSHFTHVNWQEYPQVTKAFRKLIELLEIGA